MFTVCLAYGLLLIWLTFFYGGHSDGRGTEAHFRHYNFVPFKNILHFYHHYGMHGWPVRQSFLINVFGNLLLFLPGGFMAFWLLALPHKIKISAVLALLLPLLIECGQALTGRGIWDIDDIILNSSGWMLGYFIAFLYSKFASHPFQK